MIINMRSTEPFYYPGGRTSCVLIHSFTGSPAEMEYLGKQLNAAGFTVSGLRLPGHGTTVEEMAQTSWSDWRHAVHLEVEKMRRESERVVAVGLSMGGLLALDAGNEGLVDGVVAMNAPMILYNRRAYLTPFVAPFVPFIKKHAGSSSLKGKVSRLEEGFWYDRIPLNCLVSLIKAIPKVRRNLSRMTCPVLLMQSVHDKTVVPRSLEIIAKHLKVTPSIRRWEKSGHILTLGPERDEVAEEVIAFVRYVETLERSAMDAKN